MRLTLFEKIGILSLLKNCDLQLNKTDNYVRIHREWKNIYLIDFIDYTEKKENGVRMRIGPRHRMEQVKGNKKLFEIIRIAKL